MTNRLTDDISLSQTAPANRSGGGVVKVILRWSALFLVSSLALVGASHQPAVSAEPRPVSAIDDRPPITAGAAGDFALPESADPNSTLVSVGPGTGLPTFPPPAPETVFGTDERLQVVNTTAYPFSTIAFLGIDFPGGVSGTCSGTLIGPDLLITAAHCLYDSSLGYAASVWVAPGLSGVTAPFGSQYAVNWGVPNGWVSSGTPDYDWGLVKLPNTTMGMTTSWRWLGVFGDPTITAASNFPTVVGYPGDKSAGTMWWGSKSSFASVTATQLSYTIDTFSGQSGSGIYLDSPSSPAYLHVVGVHAYGGVTTNSGRRIDSTIASSAAAWCVANGCSLSIYYEGSPYRLAFSSVPTTGLVSNPLTDIVVQSLSSAGALVPSDNTTVVSFAATGPGSIVCTGGNSKTVSGGIATFTGCTGTTVGNYNLQASAPGMYSTTIASLSLANPAPVASLISPSSATAGDSAFVLTVSGSGFVPSSIVQWNGSARTTTFVNSGQLTAQVTAPDIASSGSATVTVITPGPGGGTSTGQTFTISSPPATKLTFVQQPSGAPSGTALAVQPVVAVQTAASATVATDNVTVVSLSLQSGSGSLSCTNGLSRVVSSGLATFSGCTVTGVGAGYSLSATSTPALVGAVSTSFSMSATGSTGTLRVTTAPAVPAQIFLNGIPRDNWGLTWLDLPAGTYEVSFSDIGGFKTPAPQLLTITTGATTTFAGNFTPRGFLRVLTSPALPATISVDGSPRNEWGLWTEYDAGSYQVCFGLVQDFTAPGCQQAVVQPGQTTTITGTYSSSPGAPGPTGVGFLRVTTSPAAPAQIFVDGKAGDSWGLTWLKLVPGLHVVTFSGVGGFAPLGPQVVSISNGATTPVSAALVANGTLRVITSPPLPATISVDGSPRNNWGIWTDLPPGAYQVCYGSIAGFTSPACENVNLSSNTTTTVTGTYVPN